MTDSFHKEELKYQALAEIALAAAGDVSLELVAQKGLAKAVEYIDLAAGALILWNEKGEVTAKSVSAERDEDRQILLETESSLLAMLRRDFQLKAAYLELGDDPVRSLFSLPIKMAGRQFGTLIGIKEGEVRLHDYDEFLRALAAALTLASLPAERQAGAGDEKIQQKVKAERDAAIIELSIAINHEINNPLTALIGNIQLLVLKNQNLPEDIKARLKVIEESANQIKEVTARLMKAADAPSVEYTGKMRMIDILGRKKEGQKNGEDEKK